MLLLIYEMPEIILSPSAALASLVALHGIFGNRWDRSDLCAAPRQSEARSCSKDIFNDLQVMYTQIIQRDRL